MLQMGKRYLLRSPKQSNEIWVGNALVFALLLEELPTWSQIAAPGIFGDPRQYLVPV